MSLNEITIEGIDAIHKGSRIVSVHLVKYISVCSRKWE